MCQLSKKFNSGKIHIAFNVIVLKHLHDILPGTMQEKRDEEN